MKSENYVNMSEFYVKIGLVLRTGGYGMGTFLVTMLMKLRELDITDFIQLIVYTLIAVPET